MRKANKKSFQCDREMIEELAATLQYACKSGRQIHILLDNKLFFDQTFTLMFWDKLWMSSPYTGFLIEEKNGLILINLLLLHPCYRCTLQPLHSHVNTGTKYKANLPCQVDDGYATPFFETCVYPTMVLISV